MCQCCRWHSVQGHSRYSPGVVALSPPLQQEVRHSSLSPSVSGLPYLSAPGTVGLLGFSGNCLLCVVPSPALFSRCSPLFSQHTVPSSLLTLSYPVLPVWGGNRNKLKRVTGTLSATGCGCCICLVTACTSLQHLH